MNTECGKEWTRKFLRDSFTATFINGDLKAWRENLLFEREKALLPATQIYTEALYRIKDIDKEIEELSNEYHRKRNELYMEKYRLQNPNIVEGIEVEVEERRQFVQPCSVDDCRGYLSTQWKCGLCATWACPDCHEIIGKSKDAEHTCDPNNVETARLLKKETKPCPKCSASIYKIDGCDQIWCTQCHTAFSWKTGKLETKIHNPHYYEWLRNNEGSVPRDPLDQPFVCGEGLEVGDNMRRQFEVILRDQHKNYSNVLQQVRTIIRNVVHLQEAEIRPNNYYETRNRDLRIKFLMNEIDETQMKMSLQLVDKKISKRGEINTVYEMVSAASGDILRRFLRQLMYTRTSERRQIDTSILDEFKSLSTYANDCLIDIHYVYGGEILVFLPTLDIVNKYFVLKQAYKMMNFDESMLYSDQAKDPELDAKLKSRSNDYFYRLTCWKHAAEHTKVDSK
jgi:hypothetical protein